MVTFKYIEDLIEKKELIPEFDACSEYSQTFSLMRLQCKGNIYYDEINGPTISDKNHLLLCTETIKLARLAKSDILLTPEYSIPYSIIDEIIENKDGDLRPEQNKLWCLCCQACKIDEFRAMLNRWKTKGALLIENAVNDIAVNSFVDVMLYVFCLKDNSICIVPQLKTHPMADGELKGEQNGMCLGKLIYKIGKDKPNQLCTIICADSLNRRMIGLSNIFQNENENIILLHPQLNVKPRHDAFADLRKDLFNYSDGNSLVYITANWACNTNIINSNTQETNSIKNPWSCIYIKDFSEDWLNKQRELRKRNYVKGIRFGYLKKLKLDIWYGIEEENIQIIKIKKPRGCGAAVTSPVNVVTTQIFIPSSERNNWIKQSNFKYKDNIDQLIAADSDDYKYPLQAEKEDRDKFFGFCLGNLEIGQLSINNEEICNLVSMHVDSECEELREMALDNYNKLVYCLNNIKLPKRFGDLANSFTLTLDDNIFNLVSKGGERRQKVIVAYAKNEKDAKEISARFEKLLDERKLYVLCHAESSSELEYLHHGSNKSNYCIFTQENGTTKIITYPKFDDSIDAADRVSDLTSIVR